MRHASSVCLLLGVAISAPVGAQTDLVTVAEKSGFTATARHEEVVALMDRLAESSRLVTEPCSVASILALLAAVTVSRTVPSAMNMSWPVAMCLNTPGWGNGSAPGSCVSATGTKLTLSPGFSKIGSSRRPRRSFMPPRS